ncbi:MAG TPA: septum formation family protein [Trebonia sp.]|nr:septum formation family protein [Trebonia sp.]
MFTEATGDGGPNAAGRVEPDAAVAAREDADLGAGSAAGDEGDDGELGRGDPEEPGDDAAYGDDRAYEDSAAYDAAYEHDRDFEDDRDDAAGEDDQDLAYDEDYEVAGADESAGEDPDESAAPRRARRWPRALLALGFVVLGVVIVGGAIAIVGTVTHGFKKPVKVTYTKSPVFSLRTGDCFDPSGQSYSLVSCASPHEAEVYATFRMAGTTWPGSAAVAAAASGGCASRLDGYLNPQLAISLSSTYVYPDATAWQAGTRTVVCEVRATDGELTGSVRGASATAG